MFINRVHHVTKYLFRPSIAKTCHNCNKKISCKSCI